MKQTIYQVDAFTQQPFAGNPAGVCIMEQAADEQWMRQVAREMNLSETAFLYPIEDGYHLRWFTPAAEVDLCGHATLGTAHILWETGRLGRDQQARFHTRSGLLTAIRKGDWIEMDFPARIEEPVEPPPDLLPSLGIQGLYVGKNLFDYLVEVASAEIVRQMKPDFSRLSSLPVRGVIVASRSDVPEYDFVSRFFAPAVGVNEDPVTGSAHCCLGPYWAGKLHKNEFLAYQASARGGVLRVRVDGERVLLGGQAITVLAGELRW
jgi:PhzF family phenazine biosynthesis protein